MGTVQAKPEDHGHTRRKCVRPRPAFPRELCPAPTWRRGPPYPEEAGRQGPVFIGLTCLLPWVGTECSVLCFSFLLFRNIFLKECYFSAESHLSSRRVVS